MFLHVSQETLSDLPPVARSYRTISGERTAGVSPPQKSSPISAVSQRNIPEQANSATAGVSKAISGVSGATQAEGQNRGQETTETGTTTPRFLFVVNDSEKLNVLTDLLKSSVSERGNMIIYVNETTNNYNLQALLHREGFDMFSR